MSLRFRGVNSCCRSGGQFILSPDSLFLRVRPQGTKTWLIEYEFGAQRRKYTIGIFDSIGAPQESITAWLKHRRLSLAQARAIASQWKADRRAGRDPVAEWEASLAEERDAQEAARKAEALEAQQPTVRDVINGASSMKRDRRKPRCWPTCTTRGAVASRKR
jgi:hypothetical protein